MNEPTEYWQQASSAPAKSDESLPACFARMAAVHGHRTALVSEHGVLTYRELNEVANRLANELRRRPGAPGDRAAILCRLEWRVIVAMLAVVKIGRIAVVLNATDTPARLQQLMEDADPSFILTDEGCRDTAEQISGMACAVVRIEDYAAKGSVHDPDVAVDPGSTAFLVYTSGTTGRPKGVMQTHRQIVHNTVKHSDSMQLSADDRIALFASLSGSQGVGTAWSALLLGATLVPFPTAEKGVAGLARWLAAHAITVYISSASLFRHFMQTLDDAITFQQVRAVRIASETAMSADFQAFQKHFSPSCVFVHTLSSSETGNIAHLRLFGRDSIPDGRLPVGRAATGMEVLLLDEQDREVARGEIGEIVIKSRYLAAGYWRNKALTSEQFGESGDCARLFRGGDLGRINSSGLLEFTGRRDSRVKVRGFRVEISEVEAALLQLPDVERVAVCVSGSASGDSRLVAFAVSRDNSASTLGSRRRALHALLPDHMIPSRFITVEEFPLTPHGKIDRDRLLQIESSGRDQKPENRPQTATERLLAEIWARVLNSHDFGRQDDFFDLGGDSLRAAVVAARVHDALGVDLNLGFFADHPTLMEFARAIEAIQQLPNADLSAPSSTPTPNDEAPPISMFQERIWNFCQPPETAQADRGVRYHQILGPLNVEVLRECLDYMNRRHEILRTTFAPADGIARQIVHPPAPVALPLLDLSGMPDPERHALLTFTDESSRTVDLIRGPLFRFLLARIREGEHWLLRISHLIATDGWSWNIYFEELARLYEARIAGEAFPLPEFASMQYGAYAVWQRSAFNPASETYRNEVNWWKSFLADAPSSPSLPFKRSEPPARLDPTDGIVESPLDPDTSERLDDLARSSGATYYHLRLAAFVPLLSAETGEADVVIGTYMANRNRWATQNMLGHVTNLVTLRYGCDLKSTFHDWLSFVRKTMTEIAAHGEMPYEELRKGLSAAGVVPPEIRVIVNMTADHATARFAGLAMKLMKRASNSMPWGFTLMLDERGSYSNCSFHFDAALYDPSAVRAFHTRYTRLLDAVSRQPDLPINKLLAIAGSTPRHKNPSLKMS